MPSRSRPYQQTDPPREWARKRILNLEDKVAALTATVAEQSSILDALLASRLGGVSQGASEVK